MSAHSSTTVCVLRMYFLWCVCVCVQSCPTPCDPRTIARQASLCMECTVKWTSSHTSIARSIHLYRTQHSHEQTETRGPKEFLFGADDLLVLTVKTEALKPPMFIGSVCSTPLIATVLTRGWGSAFSTSDRASRTKLHTAQKSRAGRVEGTLTVPYHTKVKLGRWWRGRLHRHTTHCSS